MSEVPWVVNESFQHYRREKHAAGSMRYAETSVQGISLVPRGSTRTLTAEPVRCAATEVNEMDRMRNEQRELATEIASLYGALPGVVAVALAGSFANAAADAESDFDLYVYAPEPVDLAARQQIVDRYASRSEIGNDAWEPGDEWIHARTGQKVDVIYRTPGWIEDQLERVLVRHEASVGYSTSFWHNVLHSEALVDPSGWYRQLQQTADQPYPDALKRAIVAKNHPLLREAMSSFLNQIRLAVDRDDGVSVQHRVTGLLGSYFDILFAVNELPHPGEKRLAPLVVEQGLAYPPGMPDRIDALLQAGTGPAVVSHADALIDGLDALLREQELLGSEDS